MHPHPHSIPDQNAITLGLTACLILSACGGRGALGGQDLGPILDTSGASGGDLGVVTASGCAIGIRVDECCSGALPVSARMFNVPEDPCLVPYVSSPHPAERIPQVCQDQWPDSCMLLNCTWSGPISRLVELSPAGECRWKSECSPELNDCDWGVDLRQCCGCGKAIPTALPLEDLCVVNITRVWESWPDNPPGCANACPTGFQDCDKECYKPPPGSIPCQVNPADPSLHRCSL